MRKSLERSYGIAAARSRFKSFFFRVSIHFRFERTAGGRGIAAQHVGGTVDKTAIFGLTDISRAYTSALTYSVVKARAILADICGKLLFAGRQSQCFIDKRYDRKNGRGPRVRSEIPCSVVLPLAAHNKPRVFFGCDLDIRIGLCILQFYIVPRCVLFYQRVFKRQRFHFGVTENILKTVHRRRHSLCFQIFFTVAEILRHAVAQLARFSDINDLSARVLHYIHTGTERYQARFPQKAQTSFLAAFGSGVNRRDFVIHVERSFRVNQKMKRQTGLLR